MFKLDWGTYLTTSEDIIYAVIDGRGSGFRGDDLLFELYYKLGGPEVEDQLDVTRQLLKRFSFLDKSKVAIWGWSYGGILFLILKQQTIYPSAIKSCCLEHTVSKSIFSFDSTCCYMTCQWHFWAYLARQGKRAKHQEIKPMRY